MATAELASGPATKDTILTQLDRPIPDDPLPPPKFLTLERRTTTHASLRLPDSQIQALLDHGTLEEVRKIAHLLPIGDLTYLAVKLIGCNCLEKLFP